MERESEAGIADPPDISDCSIEASADRAGDPEADGAHEIATGAPLVLDPTTLSATDSASRSAGSAAWDTRRDDRWTRGESGAWNANDGSGPRDGSGRR